jgi:hypothetical protein
MEKPQTRHTIEASIAAYRQKFGAIIPTPALRTVKRRSAALPADTRRLRKRAVQITVPQLQAAPLYAAMASLRSRYTNAKPHTRAGIIVTSLFVIAFGVAIGLKAALPKTVAPSAVIKSPLHSVTSNTQATAQPKRARTQSGPIKARPSFKPLVPTGKNIDDLGGWSLISPPNREPVYAFADTIGTVSITVSEQLLPQNFITDTAAKVKDVATNFNADKTIEAGGTTVYIGTSAQGPQSILFSKNKLLVLMRSTAPVTNEQWVSYIQKLQ